jgi:hypothetical protein
MQDLVNSQSGCKKALPLCIHAAQHMWMVSMKKVYREGSLWGARNLLRSDYYLIQLNIAVVLSHQNLR